jgi:tetratricopeptide (TPR) repeat protein
MTRSQKSREVSALSGRVILHFEIREKLGEGGMGVVYSALDRKLNRLVALKFLPPGLVDSKESLERLVEEANAISALSHPNIATIYSLEESGGERFLVLEHIAGGTLKNKLRTVAQSGRWLTIGQILNYAIGAAEGLAHAHRRGIVHRDIKTSNLMVTEEDTVKITDFGLARIGASPGATKPGLVAGTAAYMSPEQAQGGAIDARSDIFSFGVTLFELATGRLPFEASEERAMLSEIINRPAPKLREYRVDAPETLGRVVSKSLEKRREHRYQSMDELLGDLRALRRLSEADTATKELEQARPAAAPVRRRWLLVAGLAAMVAPLSPRVRQVYDERFRPPPAVESKLLAVLPFHNLGQPADDALCAGLMEILTNKLTQLEQFQGSMRVVAASDVLSQHVGSAREARNAFGAALALTGSVQRDGQGLVLTINLVDTKSQAQLGAHTIEHNLESLAVLQSLLLDSVAEILMLELRPEARQTLAAGVSAAPAAYNYYVTGRGNLQRYDRMENLESAIAMFRQAVELDPNYALAYAGVAEAYWRKYQLTKDSELLELARTHGLRAITLNDRLSPVLVTMGLIETSGGQYGDAVRNFNRALRLEPLNVDAHRGLASAFEGSGRPKEAEAIYRQAIRLRPNHWASHRDLGVFYFNMGRYSEAEPYFKSVIKLTPDNYRAYSNLGATYLKLGRTDEAAQMYKQSLVIKPDADALTYSGLGSVYYFQERYADAATQFEKAVEFAPKDFVMHGNLADAYRYVPALSNKAPEEFRKAIELAKEALATNPKDAKLRANVAGYRSSSGDRAGSLRDIQEAVRLGPGDGFVLFRAALVYEQAGMRERAWKALEACINAGYSIEEIRKAPPLADLRKDERYRRLVAAQSAEHSISPGKQN